MMSDVDSGEAMHVWGQKYGKSLWEIHLSLNFVENLELLKRMKKTGECSHKLPFCFKHLLVRFVRNSLNDDDEFISASRK